MIDAREVLRDVPRFDTFCSVEKLHRLAESLRSDSRFMVCTAGTSANGLPIHHVRFGNGSVKALFLAFPHPMEPIGGLTVFSLITLLRQDNRALLDLDVEWNFVPCADPDGALLNEAWSQEFTIENYLRNYYMQPIQDQASMSFPITYKCLKSNKPSQEAKVVMSLLEKIKPDLYCSLHNTRAGGVFIGLSHDIDRKYHSEMYSILRDLEFPIQRRAPFKEICKSYGEGIAQMIFTKKFYDYVERFTTTPETYGQIPHGANDWDYLAEIKPSALSMFAESGCMRHPYDESKEPTTYNLRRLKLQVDANSKYLASVLVDEWTRVKDEVDAKSPLYRAMVGYALPARPTIAEGGWPLSRYPTAEILANADDNRFATKGEVFSVCVMDGGLYFIQFAYQFVRLLRSSKPSRAVQQSLERSEEAINCARDEINRYIDIGAFEAFDCNKLAKVQIGCCLVVLNSVLENPAQ